MSFYEYTKKNYQLRIFSLKDLEFLFVIERPTGVNYLKISIFIFHAHVIIFANFAG